jgi:predicted ester cyclase
MPSIPASASDVARRYYEQVVNARNVELLDELLAPHGRFDVAALKKLKTALTAAFPDLSLAIEDIVSERDKVAVRWTARGTHEASLAGIAPTGKRVALTGIDIMRISGGTIVEHWTEMDSLGLLVRLGVVTLPRVS